MTDDKDGSAHQVPSREGSIQEILEFADTYNAYERLAAEPEQLDRLLGPIYAEIERSSAVPGWVRIDLARALLFYAYRRDHFGGGFGPYEPMRALVDRIQALSLDLIHGCKSLLPANVATAVSSGSGPATSGEYEDSWGYSDDGVYRWWYERRWSSDPTLCFVGLNPSTGDSDGGPRPTLRKVVGWARREGCGAVVVVNLFAFRATKPDDLFAADADIVGERCSETIRRRSAAAEVTLAAWGAHPQAQKRAEEVVPLLTNPQCVGKTRTGAPKHPLYIPASQAFEPYP